MPKYVQQPDGSYVRESQDVRADREDKRFWTDCPKNDATKPLFNLITSLRSRQTWRQDADDLALSLYSDMRYVGYRAGAGTYGKRDLIESRISTNLIRSIIRTMNSKVARRRSRPYVVTDGGSWTQRQAAENIEKWLLGKLRTLRADEEIFPLWRLQALTFGTGCIRVYGTESNGVQLEVIPSPEIFVDDSEARYGTPPRIYFVRMMSKAKLRHDYPDFVEIIDKADSGAPNKKFNITAAWDSPNNPDICTVVEAISLPSGEGADDGRHVIALESGTLVDEKWTKPHFNCAFMRGELRPMGFWGIGVPEDLAAIQLEASQTAMARQEIIELLANPYWLLERGMKVMRGAISSLIGRVMEYTNTGSGHEPKLVTPGAVPQELWQHEDYLKRTAFETRGVSQLSAQMLKPQGLNSGKALRAYTELESELLSDLMNDYESGLLRVCTLMLEEQIELAKKYPRSDHSSTYVGSGTIEKINWKDVGLEKDLKGYIIEILPASALASTLSARIEDVFDMKDLGLVSDPEEIWDYVDMPDRRRLKRKKMSHRKLLERIIEQKIVKEGKDVQVEPTWNIDLAAILTLDAITELELFEDAPQDRLELLRMFLERIRFRIEERDNEAAAAELEVAQQNVALGLGAPPEGSPDAIDPLASGAGLGAPDQTGALNGPEESVDLGGGSSAAEAAAAGIPA